MGKKITKYGVKLVKEECKVYNFKDLSCDSSQKAINVIEHVFTVHEWTVEKMGMLCLNTQNDIIGVHIVSSGILTETLLDIRGIFQRAILNNSTRFILFHNHPGGGNKPSKADIDATSKIKQAGKLLDLELLDHIILYETSKGISMTELGYI